MSVTSIDELLTLTVQSNGSDLHLKSGSRPLIRVFGELLPVESVEPMPPQQVHDLAYSIMSDFHKERFEKDWELDMAYVIEGLARFRVNVFIQR